MELPFELLIWGAIILFAIIRAIFSSLQKKNQPETRYAEKSEDISTDVEKAFENFFGENIFGEKTSPVEITPPVSRAQKTGGIYEAPSFIQSKYDAYTGTNFNNHNINDTSAEEALRKLTFESPSLSEETDSRFDFIFEQDEIRKGIIFSEILGRPKSRRD